MEPSIFTALWSLRHPLHFHSIFYIFKANFFQGRNWKNESDFHSFKLQIRNCVMKICLYFSGMS